jgi:uncharacterized membrane protein YeaQ/YmgE (transglycosylase-associated protein family)
LIAGCWFIVRRREEEKLMLDIPNNTLVTWIVVGAIAGFIASILTGSREGLVMMVVLGIVGAVVGGWVAGNVLKIANVNGVNTTSVIVAVVGALIVVFVVGSLGTRRGGYGFR